MQSETILNVFPGASDTNRLALVQTETICGLRHLVLRQESYSPDVGWFTQSCVVIEPEQVAALKMTLSPQQLGANGQGMKASVARPSRPQSSTAPTTLRLHEAV
ncbi:hypothetical protein [Stieleria varia]|uniref:hypothetical protein n=1 Tax=Stieleria varia TaxID=2528005 RepID=UPI0011B50DEE|nr:hypothetical protein [Stieleria varia]